MATKHFVFVQPYTLQSTGCWPLRSHQIMFEDTPVVFSCNDHELASRVVAALNGAYNLGRSHERVEGINAELIEAARNASATLGHAYHTVLTGELAEYAHTDYQRLDAALAKARGEA